MTGTSRAPGGHDAGSADRSLTRFEHETLPQRVCFASGESAATVRAEVERLGAARVMVIAAAAEEELAQQVTAGLPVVLRWSEVVMHVPVEVAERARAATARHHVDCLVSVGGGSTTGLAKAIALTTDLPIVAVPTTYAGSEATSVWGLTEQARKTTGVDARVLPRSIVYDATLTVSLPVPMSVASGLNALAHCVDAMWGPRVDPIDRALAAEGIRALATGLPAVVADPAGLWGRERTLYGTYLSAVAFSSAGSGLHHKICHVLGAGTTCRTPRPTRWCCPTCWRSTHPPPRKPNNGSRPRSARSRPSKACSGSGATWTHRRHCATTGCERPMSTTPCKASWTSSRTAIPVQ